MKKIIYLLLSLATLHAAAQQTQKRTISNFNGINATGAARVIFKQADSISVIVNTVNQDEQARVFINVNKEVLEISMKGDFDGSPKIYVSGPSLISIVCSGASYVSSEDTLRVGEMTLDATGASKIDVTLRADKIKSTSSGASTIKLSGYATVLEAASIGASLIKATDLQANEVTVNAHGASSAKVYAVTKIAANATDASSIKIKGNPTQVEIESTAAASVKRIPVENGTTADTLSISWKGKNYILDVDHDGEKKKKDPIKKHFYNWVGMTIGVNGLMTPALSTTPENRYSYMELDLSRSFNFQLNPFQYNFHIYKNRLNLVTGAGLEFRSYRFANNVILNPDSSFTYGQIDNTQGITYRRNNLNSVLLQVPLLLEYNSADKRKKSFHVAAGVVGQYMISSNTFQRYVLNGYDYTRKRNDNYNMNPFQAKAHFSVGYGHFTAFAEYNVNGLFAKNKGPVMNPFTVGIRVIPFVD